MTWLVTAQIPVLVFLVAITGGTIEMARQQTSRLLWSSYPAYPTPPKIAPVNRNSSPKWQAYQAEVAVYREESARLRSAWKSKQPWYIANSEALLAISIILSIAWSLSSLLRSVGVPRKVIPIARPPTCEACGYNLTHMPMESRCPECGEYVVKSLGAESRGGTVWQARSTCGFVRAWWFTTVEAIKRPATFGRLLQTQSFGSDHRRFLVMHLPIIYIFAYMTVPIGYLIDTHRNPLNEQEIMTLGAPIFGLVITSGTAGIVLFMALLVGGHFTRLEKRNLIPPAMQMSCYLMGYLMMWLVFGFATCVIGILLERSGLWMTLQNRTGIYRDVLATLFVLIPNLLWFLYGFKLVARGTAAARYANR